MIKVTLAVLVLLFTIAAAKAQDWPNTLQPEKWKLNNREVDFNWA